jgi:hypothetical protein
MSMVGPWEVVLEIQKHTPSTLKNVDRGPLALMEGPVSIRDPKGVL